MSKFKFEKYVFGCFLNNRGVAKSRNSEGQIELVVVDCSEYDSDTQQVFDSEEEYENFVDSVTTANDQIYNKVRALKDLIAAMSE